MPSVKPQNPKGSKTVSKGGLRDRIRAVGDIQRGLKFSIYGQAKTGKTSLACTFPGRKLIIGTEDGTESVSDAEDVDIVMIDSSDEFDECLKIAVEDGYNTVISDTVGGFQLIVLREVLRISSVPQQLSWGIATQQDWGLVAANFKEHMNKFYRLAETHQKNMIALAHERNHTKETEMEKGMLPDIGSALTGSARLWLDAAADYVCQTYIREKIEVKTSKVNGVEKVSSKATGKMEYCLRVTKHLHYTVGFRLPASRRSALTDDIVDPNYDKIAALITGE